MVKWSDDEVFERLEQKIEKDVANSWHQADHPPPKQVVILAGPQLTDMHLAHQFFIHHASRYRPNQRAASLSGWAWPWMDPASVMKKFVHPNVKNDRLFDLLIEFEDNEALVHALLSEIERTWIQDATMGIILGSEYLDQTPDSARVIQRILNKLEVRDPRQVTIVLNYPSSRVTQWNGFFSIATQNTPMSYHDYICNLYFESLSLPRLKTSTNPLRLAQEFRSHDWAVALIDLQGLANTQQDLGHVIACQILSGTTCQHGNVVGIPVYPTNITITGPSVNDLDAMQQEELENYFAGRDCFYQDDLLHDGPSFDVLLKTNLWSKCASNQYLAAYYEQLSEPEYLWSLIRSQVSCPYHNESTTNTSPPVQQNISSVSDSLSQQTVPGVKVVAVPLVCALLVLLVVAIRYHKVRQGKPVQSDVLRMWDRSEEVEPGFSSATLSTSATYPVGVDLKDNEIHDTSCFEEIDLVFESQATRGTLT